MRAPIPVELASEKTFTWGIPYYVIDLLFRDLRLNFENKISLIASLKYKRLNDLSQEILDSISLYKERVLNLTIFPMTNFVEITVPANFANFLAVTRFIKGPEVSQNGNTEYCRYFVVPSENVHAKPKYF